MEGNKTRLVERMDKFSHDTFFSRRMGKHMRQMSTVYDLPIAAIYLDTPFSSYNGVVASVDTVPTIGFDRRQFTFMGNDSSYLTSMATAMAMAEVAPTAVDASTPKLA